MQKNFCGVKVSRFHSIHRLMIIMWMCAWRVSSVQSTTRYQESQVSLAVYIVVDQTFTCVDLHTQAYLLKIATYVFFV